MIYQNRILRIALKCGVENAKFPIFNWLWFLFVFRSRKRKFFCTKIACDQFNSATTKRIGVTTVRRTFPNNEKPYGKYLIFADYHNTWNIIIISSFSETHRKHVFANDQFAGL